LLRGNYALLSKRALSNFQAFLQRRSLRVTGVRRAIVEAALEQRHHFQAEDLLSAVRARGHAVSPATVYRALPLLLEAGLIQSTEVSGERRRFEISYGRQHHDHLICRGCNKVVEFHFEAFAMLEREIAKKYGFELLDHVHELIGLCDRCRRPSGEPSH
jgi:Fur family ferric uptake transcriptional regulator